jgi:hypothetical protein
MTRWGPSQQQPALRGAARIPSHTHTHAQIAPLAGQHLSPEQLNCLFASGLRASGPHALAVSAAGFAAAVLDAGLVDSGAHLRRHPVIAQRPPFSAFRCVLL